MLKKYKAIIGLGNPEPYSQCRHNVGEWFISHITGKSLIDEYHAILGGGLVEKDNMLFFTPLDGMMNDSGKPLTKFLAQYQLSPEDILVVYDDVNLPVGSYQFSHKKSTGGHNGIKSVANELQSTNFARLKIGIGKSVPLIEHVLSEPPAEEREVYFRLFDEILTKNSLNY